MEMNEIKLEIKELNNVLEKEDHVLVKGKTKEELIKAFMKTIETLKQEIYDNLDEETIEMYDEMKEEGYASDSEADAIIDVGVSVDDNPAEDLDNEEDQIKDIDDINTDDLINICEIVNGFDVGKPINMDATKIKILDEFLGVLEDIAPEDEHKISSDVWDFNDSCYKDEEEHVEEAPKPTPPPKPILKPASKVKPKKAEKSTPKKPKKVEPPVGKTEENKHPINTGVLAPAYNKSLKDIVTMVNEGDLTTQPDFQRNADIWKKKDKIRLINTILKGHPIPELYIATLTDIANPTGNPVVIDGQQRIGAICEWMSGDLEGQVKSFDKLFQKEQKTIQRYPLVMRDLGNITIEQAEEVFRDLNATTYSLNPTEIFNSEYGKEKGLFNVARSLKSHNLFNKVGLFSDSQRRRMKDIEFMLLILASLEHIDEHNDYFTGAVPLKKYLVKYGDEFPSEKEYVKKFNEVADLIESLKLKKSITIFRRVAPMFSLIVELMQLDKLPKKAELKKKVTAFEKIMADISDQDYDNPGTNTLPYVEFHKHTHSGSSSKLARVRRGEVVRNYIL